MSHGKLEDVKSDIRKVQNKFDRALAKWCNISDKVKDARERYKVAKTRGRSLSKLFHLFEIKTLKSTKNKYYHYIKKQAKNLDELGRLAHRIQIAENGFLTLASSESSISSSGSVYSIPGMFDDESIESNDSIDSGEPPNYLSQWQLLRPDRLSC